MEGNVESHAPVRVKSWKFIYQIKLPKSSDSHQCVCVKTVLTVIFDFRLEYPPWRMFTTDNQQTAQGCVPDVWDLCRRLSFYP